MWWLLKGEQWLALWMGGQQGIVSCSQQWYLRESVNVSSHYAVLGTLFADLSEHYR